MTPNPFRFSIPSHDGQGRTLTDVELIEWGPATDGLGQILSVDQVPSADDPDTPNV
jgi:hypothetical protein